MKSVPLLFCVSEDMVGPLVPVREQYQYCVVQGLVEPGEVVIYGEHRGGFTITLVTVYEDGRYELDFSSCTSVRAIYEGCSSSNLCVFLEG